MFKNLKLGTKIGLGFGALLLIAVALGGLATWSMLDVKTTAMKLAEENVPAVAVADNVERMWLHTMYQARGYAYTEEKPFLDSARKNLEEVKKFLTQAKEHAAKYDLATLRGNAAKAEVKVQEYETLLNETVAKTDAMAKDKTAMDEAADRYMQACAEFRKSQEERLKEEAETALGTSAQTAGAAQTAGTGTLTAKALEERAWKLAACNTLIELGNAARIGNWKAHATRDPDLFRQTQKKFDEINLRLDELKKVTIREVNLKQIDECRAAGKAYNAAMSDFLTNWLAHEDLNKKRNEAANAVLTAAEETAREGMDSTAKASAAAAGSLSAASMTMIIGLAIGVVVGIGLAVFITRSITKPISRIIEALNEGADHVASAAGQVSNAGQSLAQGTGEQAAAIEETSASIEEMSSMTKQNTGNAGEARNLAAGARDSANKGVEAMTKMSRAIDDIKKSADQTAKIVKTIDEIAFQTNLLALNAAVEAARAGDAGKGFAVVADEVRNLAQRSAEAAKNTANMIEESVKNAEKGVVISQDVGQSLTEIADAAKKVNDLVAEIAASSAEQSQGIDQVNTAVQQMDKVTQSNTANAEESASAAEELSAQAEELAKAVGELVGLVGGSGRGRESRPAVRGEEPSPAQVHPALQALHHNLTKKPRGKPKNAGAHKDLILSHVRKGGGNGHGQRQEAGDEKSVRTEDEEKLARY